MKRIFKWIYENLIEDGPDPLIDKIMFLTKRFNKFLAEENYSKFTRCLFSILSMILSITIIITWFISLIFLAMLLITGIFYFFLSFPWAFELILLLIFGILLFFIIFKLIPAFVKFRKINKEKSL